MAGPFEMNYLMNMCLAHALIMSGLLSIF